ncbi:hypothetical protein L1887_08339 [Cichorium endivia]|nr:hypothetical protein L1887_08339 [Cichorium endivia]
MQWSWMAIDLAAETSTPGLWWDTLALCALASAMMWFTPTSTLLQLVSHPVLKLSPSQQAVVDWITCYEVPICDVSEHYMAILGGCAIVEGSGFVGYRGTLHFLDVLDADYGR